MTANLEAIEHIVALDSFLAMQAAFLVQEEYKIKHGHYATDVQLREYLIRGHGKTRCFWDAELQRREGLHGRR
jgi:hypothetical protein